MVTMLIFYDILYILFVLCYLPVFLLRRKYHRGFLMRLGIFPQNMIDRIKNHRKIIWLHTVSVGEIQAAAPLIKNLKQVYPDFRVAVSTVTETGNRIAKKLIEPEDLVFYFPLDINFIVKKIINIINPKLFIVAETEIWPNLIMNLTGKGVPAVLVNGRISFNSFRGYKLIRPFLKKILQRFNLICMQTEEDARRIIELGADKDKVKVTGNMKFDVRSTEYRVESTELGLTSNEELFIAGSTHRGEEKIILQVYKKLIKKYPNLRLLIAPRHIERTQEIKKLIAKFGFRAQRVSDNGFLATNSILILDTIGRLKSLYALAEIVFVGGSLIRHGGQNPIEPAIFSKPVLFGPYMFNFSKITEVFLDKKAAIMVDDAQQLEKALNRLLSEPAYRTELGEKAKALVEENKGAVLRNSQLIGHLLKR